MGLSPLARGNHEAHHQPADLAGPIPARAGQPANDGVLIRPNGAYPRSRGATDALPLPPPFHQGLSPLARGNRTEGS